MDHQRDRFRERFQPSDFDCDDGSLLQSAVTFGTVEFVRLLVEAGADANERIGWFKLPPLAYAAEGQNLAIVRYLIEDADSNIDTSSPRRNPLLRAAAHGSVEIVLYFLNAGIDPNLTYRVPTGKLINAYVEADRRGRRDVLQILEKYGCHKPVEGVDVPVSGASQGRILNHTFGVRDSTTPRFERYQHVVRYMEERFGPVDQDGMQERVQVIEGMSVAINVIPPNDVHPFLVLFTNGMSDLAMKTPAGMEEWRFAELVMHLPTDWGHPREAGTDPSLIWPIEWLRTLSYQPHLSETWLGSTAALVSSSDPPKPFSPSTDLSCFLTMPDLSNLDPALKLPGGDKVHFFTLVPLYSEERDFGLHHGMKAFLDRFLENEISLIVDVGRPNFALTE